jgi:acyl-CoA synthetase
MLMFDNLRIDPDLSDEYRAKGYWSDKSLLDYWLTSVELYADKDFVIDSYGGKFTYKEADNLSSRLASFLQEQGVAENDIVTFQVPGWKEFVLILVACLKVGAAANPICLSCEKEEVIAQLNMTESKVFFTPTEYYKYNYSATMLEIKKKLQFVEQIVMLDNLAKNNTAFITLSQILTEYSPLKNFVKAEADSVAAILFTSGTTGESKGVMLTHNNIIYSEKAFNQTLGIDNKDIMLMPSPLNHAIGFHHGIISPMLAGATTVLQDRFNARDSLELIQNHKCSYGMGVTPMIHDILEELKIAKYNIDSLEFFLCGGASIQKSMIAEALENGFKVCGVYGSTESVPHTCIKPTDTIDKIVNTEGSPIAGVEVKIVDKNLNEVAAGNVGQELSRGPNVFVGYLKAPQLTAKAFLDNGWYQSGDLCSLDNDVYLSFVGRLKDIIVRGGENLPSHKIEANILKNPKIKDAVVIGMPDKRMGERICGYIVLEDKNNRINLSELIDFLQKINVSKKLWPERLVIIDALPRNESGKIKKFILKADIKEKLKQENNVDN